MKLFVNNNVVYRNNVTDIPIVKSEFINVLPSFYLSKFEILWYHIHSGIQNGNFKA